MYNQLNSWTLYNRRPLGVIITYKSRVESKFFKKNHTNISVTILRSAYVYKDLLKNIFGCILTALKLVPTFPSTCIFYKHT